MEIMEILCTTCVIILSMLLQRGYCEDEVNWINPFPEYNVTLTGFRVYYFPYIPSSKTDGRSRTCEVFSKLSWGKWENIEPSVCESLHVDNNCTGYVFNDEIPFNEEDKYTWRRPKPFPYCKFNYESSGSNVLIFTRFNEYSATLIITFIDRLCINLPTDMEVTSVGRVGLHICVELYEAPNCVGEFHELPDSTPNLSFMKVNNFVNSYKPCNPERLPTHITKPDKNDPTPENENVGEKGQIRSISGSSTNLELVLFGLLCQILLLIVSGFVFVVFYWRRRILPHFYQAAIPAEQNQLITSLRQNMCERLRIFMGQCWSHKETLTYWLENI